MNTNDQPKPGTVAWLRKQLGIVPDDALVKLAAGTKEREPKTINWKIQSNEIVIA